MTDRAEIAGTILAGGKSRRMGGGDKALRMLAGRPLLAHAVARLQPQVSALAINANGDPARFAAFGLPVVPDSIGDFAGPLAGILAGLEWAAEQPGVTHLATAPADSPFAPFDLVERLRAVPADRIAIAACNGETHQVFGLWPVAAAPVLREWLETGQSRKVLAFVESRRHRVVAFEPVWTVVGEIDPFFNVNTPDDLTEAEGFAKEVFAR